VIDFHALDLFVLQQGCSVRLLNPQTYSKNVWKMLSMLQEYFGCMAGANMLATLCICLIVHILVFILSYLIVSCI